MSQLGTLASWFVFLIAFAFPTQPLVSVSSGVLGQFAPTLPLLLMFVLLAAI